MKTFLAVVIGTAAAENVGFDCPDNTALSYFGATADEATCCNTFSPTPATVYTDCPACNGTKINMYTKITQSGSCFCMEPMCSFAKSLPSNDVDPTDPSVGTVYFQCPTGKTLAQTTSTTVDEATCCTDIPPFTPACYHTESTAPTGPTDIKPFDCPDGKVFDQFSAGSPTLDAATCCTDQTCGAMSLDMSAFQYMPFDCPKGKVLKSAAFLTTSPSAEVCCEDYTPTCSFTNDEGDRHTCPDGQIEVSFFDSTESPSDANCCTETGRDCAEAEQGKCSSWTDADCMDRYSANYVRSSKTGAYNSMMDCCEIKQETNTDSATSLVLGAALASAFLL